MGDVNLGKDNLMEEDVCTDYFDGYKLGKVQKRFLYIAAIAYMFDQVDAALFSYVAPVLIQNWGLSLEKVAQLNSLTFLGMFFGGFLGGWMSDKIGRKAALLTSIFIFSSASLLTAMAQPTHFMLFELTRFLTGLGVIGMTVVAMVYIAEMMPTEHRGRYQSLCVACGTIGMPLGTLFAAKTIEISPESWRMVFILGGVSIILVPIGMKIMKESPRWLVGKGRIEEAEKVLTECLGVKADLSRQAQMCVGSSNIGTIKTIKIMFSRDYIKRTITVAVACWGVIIGNYYLGNWYPTLLTEMGIPLAAIMTVTVITTWGTPLGDFASSFVTEKGGRKTPIALTCLALGVTCIVMGYFSTSLWAFGIGVFCKAIFGSMAATMNWSYLAESFPTHIRNSASGLIFSTSRLVLVAGMATVPIFMTSIGYFGLHLVNAALFIVPALVVLFLGEKTSQKTLEQLEVR